MPACQKHRFCIENLYKNYDFESRGVRERAGGGGRHAKSNDFVLKTLTKATILRAGAAGHPKSNDLLHFPTIFNAEATGRAPRRQGSPRLQAICAKSYMPHTQNFQKGGIRLSRVPIGSLARGGLVSLSYM